MELKLITHEITPAEIRLLAKWRKRVQPLWGETFKVTYQGTKKWIHRIVDNPDKMLFFVIKNGKPIGHVGFDSIEPCFVGNIIRGRGRSDGSMTEAIHTLAAIGRKFGKNIYLKTSTSNINATRFYKKIGFVISFFDGKDLIMKYEKD